MKDINRNEVLENDYLVLDQGDIAYFYKVENGVPKVFANWMIASLGLIDYEENHKRMMSEDVNQMVKDQQKEFYKEITNVTISKLEKVSPKMESYLNLIQNNGEGHTYLEGSLEDPTHEYDEEEED